MHEVRYQQVAAKHVKTGTKFSFTVTVEPGTPEYDAMYDLLRRKSSIFVGYPPAQVEGPTNG
jgi:hypothetical protein